MKADNRPATNGNNQSASIAATPVPAAPETSATSRKKWLAGIAVTVAALGLTGVFMMHSGNKDAQTPAAENQQTAVVNTPRQADAVTPQSETPGIPSREGTTAPSAITVDQELIAQNSLQAKMATVYRGGEKTLSSVFLDAAGQEVEEGEDFSVQISLFNRGNVSVDIVAGPHAGMRAGFFPVPHDGNGPVVILEKIGAQTLAADNLTAQFSLLPASQRFYAMKPMNVDSRASLGVRLPGNARSFVKTVEKNGRTATPITLTGTPEKNGIFEVKIWNGDSYAMNLNTGDYSIRSTFMNHPDWRPGMQAERKEVWGTIPTPAPQPQSVPAPAR